MMDMINFWWIIVIFCKIPSRLKSLCRTFNFFWTKDIFHKVWKHDNRKMMMSDFFFSFFSISSYYIDGPKKVLNFVAVNDKTKPSSCFNIFHPKWWYFYWVGILNLSGLSSATDNWTFQKVLILQENPPNIKWLF